MRQQSVLCTTSNSAQGFRCLSLKTKSFCHVFQAAECEMKVKCSIPGRCQPAASKVIKTSSARLSDKNGPALREWPRCHGEWHKTGSNLFLITHVHQNSWICLYQRTSFSEGRSRISAAWVSLAADGFSCVASERLWGAYQRVGLSAHKLV